MTEPKPLKFPIPVMYLRRFFQGPPKFSHHTPKWHIRPMTDTDDDRRVLEGLCGFEIDTNFQHAKKLRNVDKRELICDKCHKAALETDIRSRFGGAVISTEDEGLVELIREAVLDDFTINYEADAEPTGLMNDEQRAAWQEMNTILTEKGDSPEYREAFTRWAATHGMDA